MKPRFPAFHCGFWGLQASKATIPKFSLLQLVNLSSAKRYCGSRRFYIYLFIAVGITPRMIYVRTFKALCRKSFRALLLVVQTGAGNLFLSS